MDESAQQGIPALLPGFRNTTLPTTLKQRSDVSHRFCYVLPQTLLNCIERPVGRNKICFDEGKWAIEHLLTESASRQSNTIGFFNGQPLQFGYLEPSPYDESTLQYLIEVQGKEQAEASLRKLNRVKNGLQAYLGWLLTNPEFLSEHRALFLGACNPFLTEGIPQRIGKVDDALTFEWNLKIDEAPQIQAAAIQLSEFCKQWRLTSLEGPFLPNPLGPQSQELVLNTDIGLSYSRQDGMRTTSVPVTMPLLTDSQTRQISKEDRAVSQSRGPEHLNEWAELARPQSNGELHALIRLGRHFRLQHYWRILAKRHSEAMNRQRERLRCAFADFFGVSEDAIKDDLRQIKNRLGEDWFRDDPSY